MNNNRIVHILSSLLLKVADNVGDIRQSAHNNQYVSPRHSAQQLDFTH